MTAARLTSLDLHLRHPPAAVVVTDVLEDAGCGVYPCYYRRTPEGLQVSTSAAALVIASGRLERNPAFRPHDFLSRESRWKTALRDVPLRLPRGLRRRFRSTAPEALISRLRKARFWYESWETIDRRVHRLRPGETVDGAGARQTFEPDFTLGDIDRLLDLSKRWMQAFVNRIEYDYPEHQHVILTGGRDSQLVALIPKRVPGHWHLFSADPNFEIVRDWVAANDLQIGQLFRDDNRNRETPDITREKLVCSDLYYDPRHMRWLPALRRIAGGFDGKCIFWSGTLSTAHFYMFNHYEDDTRFRGEHRARYFRNYFTRTACKDGIYHQAVKNFTGCALLSPYHAPEVWEHVYLHFDPEMITERVDLRPRYGELLLGRPLTWSPHNPGPEPYTYAFELDCMRAYLDYLAGELARRDA